MSVGSRTATVLLAGVMVALGASCGDPESPRNAPTMPGPQDHIELVAIDAATAEDDGTSEDGHEEEATADGGVDDTVDVDDVVDVDAPSSCDYHEGLISGDRPERHTLCALPGGGVGGPVLTSNNPEIVAGPGLLYGNARPLVSRGGQPVSLSGRFGVYLHHLVDTPDDSSLFISLLVTNPNSVAVHVDVEGAGFSQTDTGGLQLGHSPDYQVSRDFLLNTPNVLHHDVVIDPSRPFVAWQRRAADRVEVDARFVIHSDAPVFVYVVASATADVNDAVRAVLIDAPGDYRISGEPAPPFGREAGVYAHDTWQGVIDLTVPRSPAHAAFMVNTATGAGFSQVQAFPAIAHLEGSAREAVGMYGNIYDLRIVLSHDGDGQARRRARVWLTSLATANISRYWDGVATVNDSPIDIRHVPGAPSTLLSTVDLEPGVSEVLHFKAMVPGLTSLPQALVIESIPADFEP